MQTGMDLSSSLLDSSKHVGHRMPLLSSTSRWTRAAGPAPLGEGLPKQRIGNGGSIPSTNGTSATGSCIGAGRTARKQGSSPAAEKRTLTAFLLSCQHPGPMSTAIRRCPCSSIQSSKIIETHKDRHCEYKEHINFIYLLSLRRIDVEVWWEVDAQVAVEGEEEENGGGQKSG